MAGTRYPTGRISHGSGRVPCCRLVWIVEPGFLDECMDWIAIVVVAAVMVVGPHDHNKHLVLSVTSFM
jgi:uncharacterized membrane protein